MKVALSTNSIEPYRIPLFAALDETPGWKLKVFNSIEREFNRQWAIKKKFSFLHKKSINISFLRTSTHRHAEQLRYNEKRQVHLPIGLWFDLWRYKPDVIISSEMGMRSLISGLYSLLTRKPLILWFYGTVHTEKNISVAQRILRKILCKIAKVFVGMGCEARRYLLSLGISSEIIFDAENAIDMSRFCSNFSSQKRIEVRKELGISGLCFLYVGHLIPLKGINYLLDAWNLFCKDKSQEVSLLLVGDGEQKADLIKEASNFINNNIRFEGFIQPEKLPKFYHAADVFVFPTLKDVWGLVVNEAMASGLPVICSKYAGCSSDLIIDGKNGWIIDSLKVSELVEKLRSVWKHRDQIKSKGKSAQEMISLININQMADGFREAVKYVLTG